MSKSLIYKQYKGNLIEAYRNKIVMVNCTGDIEFVYRYNNLPPRYSEEERYTVRCFGVNLVDSVSYQGGVLGAEYGKKEGLFFYQYDLDKHGSKIKNLTIEQQREYLYNEYQQTKTV